MASPENNGHDIPDVIKIKARQLIEAALKGTMRICRLDNETTDGSKPNVTYAACCDAGDGKSLNVLALFIPEKVTIAFQKPPLGLQDKPDLTL